MPLHSFGLCTVVICKKKKYCKVIFSKYIPKKEKKYKQKLQSQGNGTTTASAIKTMTHHPEWSLITLVIPFKTFPFYQCLIFLT